MITLFEQYEDLNKYIGMVILKQLKGLHNKIYLISNVSTHEKGYFVTSNISFFTDGRISLAEIGVNFPVLDFIMTLEDLFKKHPEVINKMYDTVVYKLDHLEKWETSELKLVEKLNELKKSIKNIEGFEMYFQSKKYNL